MKFAFGPYFLFEQALYVNFQMSNAVVINPQTVMHGFEVDAALTLNPTDDHVTGQGAGGDPDFSNYYGGGTAKFVFDNTFTLDASIDGSISGFGNVTVTLTPNAAPVPEPASVVSLLMGFGLIGAGLAARRVRPYFRSTALSS
jgi:hypothetical protein